MKSNKLTRWLGKVEAITKKNSPVILTGFAVIGVISTAYSAYKAGPRAEKILENHRKDMNDCYPDDKASKRAVMGDTIKKMIPVMAPTILMGGTTIACVVGSNSISSKRIAVLSAAYTLSESTVKNLNSKMEEMLGEKKARSIKDAIMKDKLHADTEKDQKVLLDENFIMPGNGNVLCKDLHSGRLFYSNAERIRQAIVACSYNIVSEMWISLNDFYEAIDSPQLSRIPLGEDLGWNIDDTINGRLPITLTALLMDDDRTCLCVDYDVSVRADYRNLY